MRNTDLINERPIAYCWLQQHAKMEMWFNGFFLFQGSLTDPSLLQLGIYLFFCYKQLFICYLLSNTVKRWKWRSKSQRFPCVISSGKVKTYSGHPGGLLFSFILGQSSFIQLYIPQSHKSVMHRCLLLKNAIVPQGMQKHHTEKENSLHTIVSCIPKISEYGKTFI